MPISSTVSKLVYTGNGTTTAFPFAYKFYATSNLVVNLYLIADGTLTLQVEDTDYTVAGAADGDGGYTDYTSGGTVTMTTAPAATYKLIIERTLPITQEFDFAPNSDFAEDSFEEALDRIAAVQQQHQTEIDRCIKMDKSNTSVSSVYDVADITVEVDDFVISEFSAKTTVTGNDLFVIADSADSNEHKTVKQSLIININNETAKTSVHENDIFLIEDSQASYVKKKVTKDKLLDTVDINAGTIDGVTIGAAAAPTVTDLGTVATVIITTADINGGTLDGVNIGTTTATGELIVNNSSDDADGLGSQGTSGQYLQSAGTGANPTWSTPTSTYFILDGSIISSFDNVTALGTDFQGNTVSLTGVAEGDLAVGKVSYACYNLDGSNDWITITDPLAAGAPKLSLEMWFYKDTTGTEYLFSDVSSELSIAITDSNISFIAHTTGGDVTANKSHGLADSGTGAWVYLVCTYDGADLHIYINGVSVGSESQTGTLNETGNLIVGADESTTNKFNGKIDGFRFLRRAMSATEVLARYNTFS